MSDTIEHENSFKLVTPYRKYYLSDYLIISFQIIGLLAILLVYIYHPNDGSRDLIILIIFLLSLTVNLLLFNVIEPLRGAFTGTISFTEEGVFQNDQFIALEKIKKITINNDDYEGHPKLPNKYIGITRAFSNGTNNSIGIILTNDEHLIMNFYQKKRDDFHPITNLLVFYCQEGKLHFLNLIDILNITKYEEIQAFKLKYQLNGTKSSY